MSNYLTKKRTRKIQSEIAGFTLIELLVTLGIVILATGLVMVRYASFNSSVLLNSLAYQVAFDIRETQSLAISIRGNNAQFREEYGMHFDITTPNQYQLFQDSNQSTMSGDGTIRFDVAAEAIGDPIIVDPRFTITDLCATPELGGGQVCHSNGALPAELTVAFARPDFDAVMYAEGLGKLENMEIVLGTGDSSSSFTRSVIVTSSGQITVR